MEQRRDTAMTSAGIGLSRGSGVSVWRQIADSVAGEIAGGELRAGSRLPTEEALATRFAVNRHTVRRALAVLAEQGLVRATRGSGTFVTGPLTYPIGARTRFSEIVAAGGRDPGGRVLSVEEAPASEEQAHRLMIEPGAPVLLFNTLRSADAQPISAALSALPLPRFAGFDALLADGLTTSEAFARRGAGDYRRAWTRITARMAVPREIDLLALPPGAIVMVSESVNVDRDGTPVQWTRSSFAADRVDFLIES